MRGQALHFFFSVLALAGITGCQTHSVPGCDPPCDDLDRARFVACVAEGSAECTAGSRRCCATTAGCLGTLEDQTVVSRTTCQQLEEEVCWRPCIEMDQVLFDGCMRSGGSVCTTGDADCCALSLDCLGELVIDEEESVLVSADGCCADELDCAEGEICDSDRFECVPGTAMPGCGDERVTPPEICDDGNDFTDDCPYGEMSCEVCTSSCVLGPGFTSFCGDGEIDVAAGEECDPPGTAGCDPMCFLPPPGDCTNRRIDGDETDLDCGGSCPPCAPGQMCRDDLDCSVMMTMPLCTVDPFCDTEVGRCREVVCDDGIACTIDQCLTGTAGCSNIAPDMDRDGFDCIADCDDTNRDANPDNPDDPCGDLIDNDCDDLVDEGC